MFIYAIFKLDEHYSRQFNWNSQSKIAEVEQINANLFKILDKGERYFDKSQIYSRFSDDLNSNYHYRDLELIFTGTKTGNGEYHLDGKFSLKFKSGYMIYKTYFDDDINIGIGTFKIMFLMKNMFIIALVRKI